MDTLPKDSVMLLSVVNTNLRDFYGSLEEFCQAKGADQEEIIKKLEALDYRYNRELNQFV